METTTLSRTDLTVSRLCFGCWGIASDFHWGERDPDASTATIRAALDSGINFFDTAPVYGAGESELLLGRALSDCRADVIIASKVQPDMMKPDDIARSCEASLQRLGTDYLDLYQTHWTSPEVPIGETWDAMQRLREQGKVRWIGVCNAGTRDMANLTASEAPATNQLPYNLLWRAIEHEILPACRESGVGVLAYSPLMHGLLADKYQSATEVPDGRARSRHFTTDREMARHGEAGCETETFAAIDAIRELAVTNDRSMASLALSWVAQQPGVQSVIAGAASPEQLAANCEALANPLTDEALAALGTATAALDAALGSNPDMWQGSGNSRYR